MLPDFIGYSRKLTLYAIILAESTKAAKIVDIPMENIEEVLSLVLILKFSQHSPYPNRIISKRKWFSKIHGKTSYHLNSRFQNFKIFGMDFALSKILKFFKNINRFFISQVENLLENKYFNGFSFSFRQTYIFGATNLQFDEQGIL